MIGPLLDRSCCPVPAASLRVGVWTLVGIILASGGIQAAWAAPDTDATWEQIRVGRYEKCLETAQKAIKDGAYSTQWRLLEIESLLALGRYKEAADRADAALRDSRTDIRLLALAHTAFQQNGQADEAARR